MRLTAANGVDVLPLLEQVADALDANARTRVRTLLTDVQTAIDQGSHARSLGGGAMAVLDEAAKAHSQLEQNLDQDISRDVAIGIVNAASELAQATQALDASRAVTRQVMDLPGRPPSARCWNDTGLYQARGWANYASGTDGVRAPNRSLYMAISILTNVASLNAQGNLSKTQAALAASIGRLSSGQRINSAGDDAAGLGISEALKANLRGLAQAQRNANDGVSLSQVAEGGMNEQQGIVSRMRELAVQSANATIGNTELGYIQTEFTQLQDEVNRIGAVNEFNGQKLRVR
ncbi:MAG: hypothetical protein NT062_11155 [Proteobacteria bacterium]|nr:hypothetical protein [Pseudomonadota bacterium]